MSSNSSPMLSPTTQTRMQGCYGTHGIEGPLGEAEAEAEAEVIIEVATVATEVTIVAMEVAIEVVMVLESAEWLATRPARCLTTLLRYWLV